VKVNRKAGDHDLKPKGDHEVAPMRVLVSDNLDPSGVDLMAATPGIEVDVRTGLAPEVLRGIIGGYDALAIRSATRVDAALLQAGTRLKVVGRAGIGLDNVEIAEATRRGVVVMNTPDGNVVTTAEHAIAMMLALTRNIPQGTASLKAGRWDKKRLQGRELFHKVAGVVGYGKIGSIVADRARGLKMRVVVHDPYVQPDRIEKDGFEAVSLDELLSRADYITIHVPKLKDTLGMIDAAAFARMKDGVMLVNCARGGIVNEVDLLAALEAGKVAGAALDVFETEPPGASALIAHERVICTPHLGASTKEAQTNVAVAVARQIVAFLKEGTILNAVNAPSVTGDLLVKLQPLLSMGEQIGRLQAQLVCGPLTEVAIEYAGDFPGLDLAPVTTAVLKGLLTREVKDDVNYVNAPILAKGRGIRVSETTSNASEEYLNLVRVRVQTTDETSTVAGTVFGKRDSRIVRINNFRLEMIPEGHLALIYNIDKPGSIGQIGSTLGRHGINIGRMQVGQEEGGDRNIIFLTTDTPIPPSVLAELNSLSLVKTAIALEF
jgi:D-3-phosphoglycerate dehydrogenase